MEEQYEQLKIRFEKEKFELKQSAVGTKDLLKETQKKLKELFTQVYKPLVKEVEIKDKIIKKYEQKAKETQRQLSILNAIIRLPRMCSEFHKVLRKKTEEIQKATEARSIEKINNLLQT